MANLLCENPEIFKSKSNTLWFNSLSRAGLARREGSVFVVDWAKVLETDLRVIRNIGIIGAIQISQWAKSAQQSVQRTGEQARRNKRYHSSGVGCKITRR